MRVLDTRRVEGRGTVKRIVQGEGNADMEGMLKQKRPKKRGRDDEERLWRLNFVLVCGCVLV